VRPTLIYGPGDPHGGYGPNKFIRDAGSIGIITLYGQGEELRDHIFIDDVGEIVAKAVADGVTGIINATSGNVVSFLQIAEIIVQQFENVKIQFIPRSSPPPHLGVRRFSSRRLSELLPDYTFTSIEKGINLMNYQIDG
jgi:nucleoside-diphosphate-sugar epimerase